MTTSALARFSAESDGLAIRAKPLRILDPSCGDGIFLVVALRALCADIACPEQWPERCEMAHRSLYGADCDGAAIAKARDNLVEVIAPPQSERERVSELMAERFQLGDALVGIGWEPDAEDVCDDDPVDSDRPTPRPIDWRSACPEVARSGGFDLILGNPPYRRERDSRAAFERIAHSPLGRRWRQPRMDLWHYFAHRALDLLRPGGRLAFVVSGYWSAARSAGPLIQRLQRETTFEEIHVLGNAAIFPGVTGRHMTFQIRKGTHATPCLIRDAGTTRTASQGELFAEGRLVTTPISGLRAATSAHGRLGDRFEVRQGIAENPPRIATAHLAGNEVSNWMLGEGVFVLTEEELAEIPWNDAERRLFRPYFAPSEIDRYRPPRQPRATLLYLHRRTAPTLDGLPHISAHLTRFHSLLERRREVRNGRIAWWHLHWPREERLFVEPRILAVQMVREPRFCVATAPTFVGFSTNVIGAPGRDCALKSNGSMGPHDPCSDLHALCGLLNSSFARDWFQRRAKRRGVNLDIGGTLLREFPLPQWENPIRAELASLAQRRALGDLSDGSLLEAEIDHLVDRWMN
ncbi:MAG: Eco57I restriction-modification methylase domain-containing protein [Planctomycetaceae bacterium]|nr:Eco57I restriction-modification methylase domain-containing protein [Planctomycetaceae bacterium]